VVERQTPTFYRAPRLLVFSHGTAIFSQL